MSIWQPCQRNLTRTTTMKSALEWGNLHAVQYLHCTFSFFFFLTQVNPRNPIACATLITKSNLQTKYKVMTILCTVCGLTVSSNRSDTLSWRYPLWCYKDDDDEARQCCSLFRSFIWYEIVFFIMEAHLNVSPFCVQQITLVLGTI